MHEVQLAMAQESSAEQGSARRRHGPLLLRACFEVSALQQLLHGADAPQYEIFEFNKEKNNTEPCYRCKIIYEVE
jgi:hypothetical protein